MMTGMKESRISTNEKIQTASIIVFENVRP